MSKRNQLKSLLQSTQATCYRLEVKKEWDSLMELADQVHENNLTPVTNTITNFFKRHSELLIEVHDHPNPKIYIELAAPQLRRKLAKFLKDMDHLIKLLIEDMKYIERVNVTQG